MIHGLQQQQTVRHADKTIRHPRNAMETGRDVRKEVPNGSADTANRVHGVQMGRNDRAALELVSGVQQHKDSQPANVNSAVPSVLDDDEGDAVAEFLQFQQYKRQSEVLKV